MNNPALFLNRVAVAFTSEEPDRLVAAFKQTERTLGRTTNGKSEGIIPIDIDLLQWNDLILKPEDLQREYVKAGIRFLQEVESGGHEKYKPNK
jgi:2-amino-4-hydroxy-6-hydroxymethyldihydropteridine diphosphokinase